jgi:catechol 2,3-dioxygenase-like lactoylglutathione lyase family enzyme
MRKRLIMIRKVDAAVLFVQDLDRCMRFYRDKLGLEVVFSDEVSFAFRMEGQDFALLQVKAAIEMLGEEAVSLNTGAGQHVMLCADVEDADAVYQTFKSRGVEFIKPPVDQPWGWRTAYFADPEGHLWEIRQSIP